MYDFDQIKNGHVVSWYYTSPTRFIQQYEKSTPKKWTCMFQYFSTVSNVADEGEVDKSDDEEQEQEEQEVFDNLWTPR